MLLALPKELEHWSLTTLREKLSNIGAKVVRHGRYVTFQLAEVAVARALFAEILLPIDGLRLAGAEVKKSQPVVGGAGERKRPARHWARPGRSARRRGWPLASESWRSAS